MPIQYKIRRGSTSEANSLTLTEGEIYMDLDQNDLRVHNGTTLGGYRIPNASSLSAVAFSGSYNDLDDKPVVIVDYNNLTNKPFEINSNIPTSSYDLNVNGLTIGKGAGTILTNTAVGINALQLNTTGIENTAVGAYTLQNNTTGIFNTAVGSQALRSNTTGFWNIAIGQESLYANTTGVSNIALGRQSLRFNSTGGSNIAIGASALFENRTGNTNIAIGNTSIRQNTTGYQNTAIGANTLYNNTTGYENTAVGHFSLQQNTIGYSNTAIGKSALSGNTTGFFNTALGMSSGISITTGSYNTIVGNYSGNQYDLDIRTSNNNIVLSDGIGWPGLIIKNGVGTKLKSVASGAGTHALKYNPTTGDVTYDTSFSSSLNNLTISTAASVVANSATDNYINVGARGQIFDDGNFHIHAIDGNIWINSLTGGDISLGLQSNSGTSVTKANSLHMNAGYGSIAPTFGVRAWISCGYIGGNMVTNGSGNLSVTRSATGKYVFTFATPMPDGNYCVTATAKTPVDDSDVATNLGYNIATTATGFTIHCARYGSGFIDVPQLCVQVVR